MKLSHIAAAALTAFAATLAVMVGQRLSSEAMAVVVGVIAGVGASIPTSLIVVWMATRNAPTRSPQPPGSHNSQTPSVVIVQGPGTPQPQLAPPTHYPQTAQSDPPYPFLSPRPRKFNILGGLEEDE